MIDRNPGLEKALAAVPTMASLALALGIKAQALSQWKKVPAGRVLAVEKITRVPRHELRPDLYPAPGDEIPLAPSSLHSEAAE